MKPKAFEYVRADTLAVLLQALAAHDGAKIIAGGQSLVPMMNFRLAQPEVLIDINGIAELNHVTSDGAVIRIGAMTRYRDLLDSACLNARIPLLAAAVRHVGYPAIRNRGTLGGSLVHNDPSAEAGVVLTCLGAELLVVCAGAERRLPLAEFFVTTYLTDIAQNEVLTEIRVPIPPAGAGFAFKEVARRVGDFAIVNVAAQIGSNAQGEVTSLSLALGGVAETPIRADVEGSLLGRLIDMPLAARVAAEVDAMIDPQDDNVARGDYKRHLAGVLVKQALLEAHAGSRAGD
ncbi:MAG: xanthine dehydrogenase family protein subunit M [Gammaproteobacteria bacterium]|nr:xanthine dehydrogenase family protein subunit M [Gammaproteobacteria bacterium]